MEDEITTPIRRKISEWSSGAPEFSIKERIDFALNCHACASVYAGSAIFLADRSRIGRVLVRILALSQTALYGKAVVEKLEQV